MVLRDHRGREWRLGLIRSPYMQIFWLDKPKVDEQLRRSLMRAFNEATSYGEPIQLASAKKPSLRHGFIHQIPIT